MRYFIIITVFALLVGFADAPDKPGKVSPLPFNQVAVKQSTAPSFPGALPAAMATDPPTGPMHTNSLDMTLKRFEPGNFMMGAGNDMWVADSPTLFFDEQPAHPVNLTGECWFDDLTYEK